MMTRKGISWKYNVPGSKNDKVISRMLRRRYFIEDGPVDLSEQGITKSSKSIHPSYHRLHQCSEFHYAQQIFPKFDSAFEAIRTPALREQPLTYVRPVFSNVVKHDYFFCLIHVFSEYLWLLLHFLLQESWWALPQIIETPLFSYDNCWFQWMLMIATVLHPIIIVCSYILAFMTHK